MSEILRRVVFGLIRVDGNECNFVQISHGMATCSQGFLLLILRVVFLVCLACLVFFSAEMVWSFYLKKKLPQKYAPLEKFHIFGIILHLLNIILFGIIWHILNIMLLLGM